MKNKKKIITIITIIFFIVISIILIYLKTDWLKTKEQLFWKYFVSEKNKIVNVFSNEDAKEFNDKIQESTYIKESMISISSKYNLIKPFNLIISEKGDNEHDIQNVKYNLEYDDKEIDSGEMINDNNYLLIKNDKLNLGYVGVENNNLKQVAKEFGIDKIDFIPNKIKKIDYYDLLYLTKDEWDYILKRYIPICRKYVKNEDYDKVDNGDTIYKVQISERQLKDVIIGVLDELKEDEFCLNIIKNKMILINDEYKDISNDKIKTSIVDTKGKIEQLESKDDKFLSIIIYTKENNVEKIELEFVEERKIVVQVINENRIIIKQYVDSVDTKIDLKSVNGILSTLINGIYEITYEKNVMNGERNMVNIDVNCQIGFEIITLNYNYVEQIADNVDDFIRKEEVKYTELRKINREILKIMLEKLLKINAFERILK